MARPKSIPWVKRVSIFLAYRKSGGKVKPVAENHGVARSTVTSIINEFREMGFSDQPRAKVSSATLLEMQRQHLQSIFALLQASGHGGPSNSQIGYLGLGPGAGEKAAQQTARGEFPFLDEQLSWHLRGTSAERLIQEASSAAHDYVEREGEAWRELRRTLEVVCDVKERDAPVREDKEPHLLPTLARDLQQMFFDADFQKQPPPTTWLEWDVQADQPLALTLRGEAVAVGDEQVHSRIRAAVAGFLATEFRLHQRRFREVEQLRRDLGLLQLIVNKALGNVEGEQVHRGVCPACPYPEAGVETQPAASINKQDG